MDEERDRFGTPWSWLRGFAWFLLAWPLLSLLALDHMDFDEWDTILIATLGPAAIGLVLLGIERALTWLFGPTARARPQSVPGILRDLSNLALTLAILLGLDLGIVALFAHESLFARAELDAAWIAAKISAVCLGAALALRGLHRVVHGPARRVDLGPGWDAAPMMLRLLGYLTLIPTLLVCIVMIDHALRGKSDFGLLAWVVLPAILCLGQRSAMARSPRYWARNPWEAWLRKLSLELPWWIIAVALGVGAGALFVLLPIGDDSMSMLGRIVAGVLLVPLGLLIWAGVGVTLIYGVPAMIGRWRAAWMLARAPERLAGWESRPDESDPYLVLTLSDGRALRFDLDAQTQHEPLLAWLREHVE